MITFIGRLFVLAVFALSLLVFAGALGVYVNHVPWKSSNREQPGIIDRLEARIKEAALARTAAEERYLKAFGELAVVEQQRVARQVFYQRKLELVKTGVGEDGQPVPAPIHELKPGPDGMIPMQLVGNEAESLKSRGQPLQALAVLERQLALRNEELLAEKAKVEQLQKQLADLTTQMQGDGANVVGLIRQKEIQVEARRKALAQQEYLKPEIANRFAMATIILKREAGLRRRLNELNSATTAKTELTRP